jgi:hypothetical protein
MTKFSSRDDPNYKMVVAELKGMIASYKSRQQAAHEKVAPGPAAGSVTHRGSNTHGAVALYGSSMFGDGARVGR